MFDRPPPSPAQFKQAFASAGEKLTFDSFEHVEAFVAENGGAASLRRALAAEQIARPISATWAEDWLKVYDAEEATKILNEQLQLSRDSVSAAQRSARYSMYSALLSAISSIVAVAAYLLSRP